MADYKNGQQATPEAYHAALLHKQALSRQVDAFFASLQVDFLLLPVAFSTAPSIDAPQEAFTAGRALVNLFSVAGVPTLVVPGELTAGGMPLGIQLVGPALSERLLLDVGTAYETTYGTFPHRPWHLHNHMLSLNESNISNGISFKKEQFERSTLRQDLFLSS